MYLTAVLRARLEPSRRAIVLSDVRIAWDLPDLRAHGPGCDGHPRRAQTAQLEHV
jgi:hypothetical protein